MEDSREREADQCRGPCELVASKRQGTYKEIVFIRRLTDSETLANEIQ